MVFHSGGLDAKTPILNISTQEKSCNNGDKLHIDDLHQHSAPNWLTWLCALIINSSLNTELSQHKYFWNEFADSEYRLLYTAIFGIST